MQRRTLLRRSAALGALALAGCSGDGSQGNATPGAVIGFGEYAVETTNTGCDDGDAGSADVSFSEDPLRITVTGALEAPTPCYEAALEGLNYDPGNDVLRVTITRQEADSADGCTQCTGAIAYEGTFDLEGELPGTVVVRHGADGESTEVARVSNDGSS